MTQKKQIAWILAVLAGMAFIAGISYLTTRISQKPTDAVPPVSPTPSSTEYEIMPENAYNYSGWNTYADPENRYAIKYPERFSSTTLKPRAVDACKLGVYFNLQQDSGEDNLNDISIGYCKYAMPVTYNFSRFKTGDLQLVTINGLDGFTQYGDIDYARDYKTVEGRVLVLPVEGYQWSIYSLKLSQDSLTENEFKMMMASFKFTK